MFEEADTWDQSVLRNKNVIRKLTPNGKISKDMMEIEFRAAGLDPQAIALVCQLIKLT